MPCRGAMQTEQSRDLAIWRSGSSSLCPAQPHPRLASFAASPLSVNIDLLLFSLTQSSRFLHLWPSRSQTYPLPLSASVSHSELLLLSVIDYSAIVHLNACFSFKAGESFLRPVLRTWRRPRPTITTTSSSSSFGASVWRLACEQDDRRGRTTSPGDSLVGALSAGAKGAERDSTSRWRSGTIVWIFNRPPKSKGDNKLWVLCCQECCQQGGVRPTRSGAGRARVALVAVVKDGDAVHAWHHGDSTSRWRSGTSRWRSVE